MSDPNYGDVTPATPASTAETSAPGSYTSTPYNGQAYPGQGYPPPQQPPYGQPGYSAPYVPPASASGGLSDNAASALAYVTIIPAIIFLVVAPYNQNPRIKFHAFQCLGLAVTGFCLSIIGIIPILGWIVFFVGWVTLLITIIICIVKASQGGALKVPVIAKFASQQSGYPI